MQGITHMFIWHNRQIILWNNAMQKTIVLTCPAPLITNAAVAYAEISGMVLQGCATSPSPHCECDGIHNGANRIEGWCWKPWATVAPTIGDNSREVHMQFEQMALLHGKPSNDYTVHNNTTIRQRRKERGASDCDRGMQRVHAPWWSIGESSTATLLAPNDTTSSGGWGDCPRFHSNELS